jgi:pimeloyl-ACP methyl ester carboxylesterase
MATEQEVTFQSGPLRLAGTLTLPGAEGRFPAVLLIPGSGRVDRDESAKRLPINTFGEMAPYMAGQGLATLRYDKRGVGASEGSFWDTGFFDNVSDALAALSFLKSDKRIRPDGIFLLGHSEGALTSTRMAATGADVAGVVLLSGSAHRGEEILVWQAQQVIKGMHGPNKWLIDFLHLDVQKIQQKQLDKIRRSTRNWYRVQLIAKMNAKWMREFMAYDPAQDLPKIRVPVLAITGSKDIQVDPADLERMAELVTSEFERHEVPDMTHMLRPEPGEPTLSTYKQQVRQPLDEQLLPLIAGWLHKHVPA